MTLRPTGQNKAAGGLDSSTLPLSLTALCPPPTHRPGPRHSLSKAPLCLGERLQPEAVLSAAEGQVPTPLQPQLPKVTQHARDRAGAGLSPPHWAGVWALGERLQHWG